MFNYPYGDNQQINLNWIISEIIALHQRLDPDYTAPTFTQIYPFSETQQLNLDWILTELKALKDLAPTPPPTELIDEIGQALIAGAYDADTSYQKNDYIVQDGKVYRANAATTGTFDPTKWNEVMLGNDLAIITRWADVTNTYLNSLAASNVANDSSVTGTTVKDALTALRQAITDLDSDNIANESTVSGATVTAALSNLKAAIAAVETVIAPILPEFKANQNFVAGVMRIYNGQLYKTTQPIQNGDDLIVGTNVKVTDVNTEFARGDARNILRYGNFQELAVFSGTSQETIQLTDNAEHYTMLLMQVFNSNDELIASAYMPTLYFHNLNVKLYGESSSQWGSFQLSDNYLSGTFNRTSATTTRVKIIGFFNNTN